MARYRRDEYEDWDEYEEDGDDQEYEEGGEVEYEEPHQPTQEELEYLELRQKLKETIRKKMKKELGTANGNSRDKINGLRKDNYGSFFGPSQPIIAARVIQESKSLLENPDLASRISHKPNHPNNKSSGSDHVKSKPRDNYLPRVTNGLKKKVEILKNTRDYSFLLSDDAEVPAPSKSLPPRNVSVPKTDARPAQQLPRSSKQVMNDRGRPPPPSNGQRKPMPSSSSQHKSKPLPERMPPRIPPSSSKPSIDSRRPIGSNNGSGPGRPVGPKGGVPPRSSVPTSNGRGTPTVARNSTSGSGAHRPAAPSPAQPAPRRPMSSQLSQSGVHKSGPPRGQPSSNLRKLAPVQREYRESSKPKVMPRHALPSSRDQVKRPPPKPAPRHISADERPKVKPKRRPYDEGSDDENPINMIRRMFGYNPDKFQDDDDDDSDMEAGFHDIEREEKRSEKLARQEDEEQLRLIEEEERRERMRMAKKRKLSH
ncbi:hypothetical protein CASFOL_015344 [Castilleja foliolosa]|uniref:Protein SPT2 homolog n=1 Tax=Castilleja foliolosa TaxID=1961234 RepID=A0ABD3DHF1_9LAMI